MNQIAPFDGGPDVERYAKCIEASKRAHWDIKKDVLRGRVFNTLQKYLPDGLSKVDQFTFLSADEQRFLSQIQGRTYANMFALAERFINAKVLDVSRDHWLDDQVKLEALIRFSDEEIKHQELFRQVEALIGMRMPLGYEFLAHPNEVADMVLGKSTWSVLGLTLLIELFSQVHYRESMQYDRAMSPLFKDVFRFHWMEECQHAIIDELEWNREDAKLTGTERDQAVDDFIDLVLAMDQILQTQAMADVEYFEMTCGRTIGQDDFVALKDGVLDAYRWQFIFSGAEHPQFVKVLGALITPDQSARIDAALARIM